MQAFLVIMLITLCSKNKQTCTHPCCKTGIPPKKTKRRKRINSKSGVLPDDEHFQEYDSFIDWDVQQSPKRKKNYKSSHEHNDFNQAEFQKIQLGIAKGKRKKIIVGLEDDELNASVESENVDHNINHGNKVCSGSLNSSMKKNCIELHNLHSVTTSHEPANKKVLSPKLKFRDKFSLSRHKNTLPSDDLLITKHLAFESSEVPKSPISSLSSISNTDHENQIICTKFPQVNFNELTNPNTSSGYLLFEQNPLGSLKSKAIPQSKTSLIPLAGDSTIPHEPSILAENLRSKNDQTNNSNESVLDKLFPRKTDLKKDDNKAKIVDDKTQESSVIAAIKEIFADLL